PSQHNKLATKHIECPCYLDPRCQMALAFQEARDYWARHPDDTANARNEVQCSIEEWLVAKRLLKSPDPPINDSQSDIDECPPSPSPARRVGFKLPRLKPLSLGRRLSLPDGSSPIALPLLSPDRLPVRRRNTDSDAAHDPARNAKSISMSPKYPTRLFRDMTGFFRSTKHKRHSGASYSGRSDTSRTHSQYPGTESARSSSLDEQRLAASGLEVPSVSAPQPGCVPSIYEDASEATAFFLPPSQSSLPQDYATNELGSSFAPQAAETSSTNRTSSDRDPAYTALVPILYEIDALTEHPKFKAIAVENHDEDYVRFWETFAQLSAKEVLYAVYAIRSGVLDVPLGDDHSTGIGMVFVALWALVASMACIYLCLCLP
ncbi:hypothetical protein C8Q79DRAFT_920682, partial [Trametes meyenii]